MKLFVIFLTLFLISSCSQKVLQLTTIEGKQLAVTKNVVTPDTKALVTGIEEYITPYRNRINNDLDSVLAVCPITLDKKAIDMQSTLGNLMADVVLQYGSTVFEKGKISILIFAC